MEDQCHPPVVRVYVVEEQEITRGTFRSILSSERTIDLVGVSGINDPAALARALRDLRPDVLILGLRMLDPLVVGELKSIRKQFPDIGIILLYAFCDAHGTRQLREYTRKYSGGCAFLLKHSIDRIGQFIQVIHAVREGQVILDSMVMESIVDAGEPTPTLLRELTHRELDVLSHMAKGYRNAIIADLLFVDTKTVERHINSIYSKLNMENELQHPRVNAIITYLRAIGQLPSDGPPEL